MKEYAFENIRLGGMLSVKIENYHQIINEYARMGYRYVGFIPTEIMGHGQIVAIDLIFEKDV